MFNRARRLVRLLLTSLLLLSAGIAVVGLWQHYMVSPWTRDGQVRVQVATIAPEVAGQIVELDVGDDQFVRKGDLLYVIDKADYQVKLALAQAEVASKKADLDVKEARNARRQQLSTVSTSVEEKQQYSGEFAVAQAAYQQTLANLDQAKLNLRRTEVRSTVNGYVTNLQLRIGNYATTGSANVSVIDADSYWVTGYFEETKLGGIKAGDPARVELMGFPQPIEGHVQSITRGISSANAGVSTQGLPAVEAVYTWVRLAQRIPVRISIDRVPDGLTLSAGMTATVIVSSRDGAGRGVWGDLLASATRLHPLP
jgi:multidrug resistance efflux pump